MKDEAFGKRFQELVKEAGGPKTLQRLGPWLGVSTTMAWLYRHGENVPSMETARFIAQKLNCCVEYLLTGRGPKRPGQELTEFAGAFARLTPGEQRAVMTLIDGLLAGHAPTGLADDGRTDGRTDGAITEPPSRRGTQ